VAPPRLAVAASLAAVMVSACGGLAAYPANASPSKSSSPSAAVTPGASPAVQSSPTPATSPAATDVPPPVQVSCPSAAAIGQKLALVNLPGAGSVAVVRDVTDISKPVTRCTIYGGSYFRFKDATHISYLSLQNSNMGSPGALYVADLVTGASSLVRSFTDGRYMSSVYSWSPDGQSLTYLSSDASGVKWHLQNVAGDRVLSDLGTVPARGANPDGDDAMVGFSADGQYLAVVETYTVGKGQLTPPNPPFQIVQAADGKLVYSRSDGTMAAWLGKGAQLYFRTPAGLLTWSPGGGVQTRNTQLQWVHPRASSDGSRLVFTAVDSTGNHRASALDSGNGSIGPLVPWARVGAAFLTPTLVWAAEEKECSANPCGMGGPPLTGSTYIYDFTTQGESRSALTAFFDSWPHVVGQA
jgi:dipeptidyl aminopeptidase/acylaminoacyl peptidase